MSEASTALAVVEGNPAPRLPRAPLLAGNAPRAIVPIDFDGAYRIANVVVTAGMAPRTLNSVEKAMVAILHGLEVGLTPMNALQSIAVINGRPTIWGDGAIGLIRGSGLLEYMQEFYENEDKPEMKAICVVKRKGEPKEVRSDFSMADAKKAGLLGKEGPWQTYPKRMLKMRARWALRDTFADVLKGLGLAEEAQDLERQNLPIASDVDRGTDLPHEDQTPRRRVPSPPAATEKVDPDPISSGASAEGFPGDKKIVAAAAPEGKENPIPFALDRKLSENDRDWLMSLHEAFEGCKSLEEIGSEQDSLMMPSQGQVSPHAWRRASDLLDQHIERVQGAN